MDDLPAIFTQLRELLKAYQPPFLSKSNDDAHYDLWSVKDLVVEGRKRKEVFFAGLIIHKNYLGFYYMPVYVDTQIKDIFAPELLKLLTGKSCFHIKKLDDQLMAQIEKALRAGFELYQQRGWV